jgi:hypothetical protein
MLSDVNCSTTLFVNSSVTTFTTTAVKSELFSFLLSD